MFSPAGLSGLVHVISEFQKQPEVSLMHIFQVCFCLRFATVTLAKASFKDTHIHRVGKMPSFNRKLHFLSRL